MVIVICSLQIFPRCGKDHLVLSKTFFSLHWAELNEAIMYKYIVPYIECVMWIIHYTSKLANATFGSSFQITFVLMNCIIVPKCLQCPLGFCWLTVVCRIGSIQHVSLNLFLWKDARKSNSVLGKKNHNYA